MAGIRSFSLIIHTVALKARISVFQKSKGARPTGGGYGAGSIEIAPLWLVPRK
jgi:hypothetical protein